MSTGRGGLSGGPLTSRTPAIVRGGRPPRPGCRSTRAAAISTVEDARACLEAGAATVQVYTALIYEGPRLVGRLRRRRVGPADPRPVLRPTAGPVKMCGFRRGVRWRGVVRSLPAQQPLPMHDEVAVRLDGVVKRFGDVTAVDGVDLEVMAGEFFSMLGPSGSGKTTCLRMIAGFEQPDRGPDLARRPGRLAPGAVRPRRQHGLPGLRAVPAHDRGRERRVRPDDPEGPEGGARTRVAGEALDMVRLAEFGDRKPLQLSGGQRQRVALARALVMRPKVLLLDEPLGALDLKLRQAMQIELKEIQQEVGLTFIYVTHDQEEALTMSDRLAVFSHGTIEQVGTPGGGVRAARDGVRRRLRRRLERPRGRRSPGRSPGARTRSRSAPRRSRWSTVRRRPSAPTSAA